jgi:hypothetical protein
MKTICPLYTWSGDNETYQKRINLLTPGDIAVVVSENSGPTPFSTNLLEHVTTLKSKSILPFGYVSLNYGKRPIDEVFEDITVWRTHYGITKIFFDEFPANSGYLGLYWNLVRGYSGKGSTEKPIVVVNPGRPLTGYLSVSPGMLVVTHENKNLPDHMYYPKHYEAAIVHSVEGDIDIAEDCLNIYQWNWGYVTNDGKDGNPYDE